ncbi:hypothetical protein MMC13_007339 [Lambiella insularis]|nr:hypothetical protein [Lambiella insularis]
MAASTYPVYPPDLTPEQKEYLLASLNDWSIAHGLAVRPSPAFVSEDSDPSGVLAVTAPVTLFPSLFPRSCFEEARSIQKTYNELYAAIASDEEWLGEVMPEYGQFLICIAYFIRQREAMEVLLLIEVDDFIAELWKIHLTVKKEGYVQDLSLGLFRSDYMVHVDPSTPSATPQIKQVEFNTIASSFGGLASQVSLLHQHLLSTSAYPPHPSLHPSALPTNPSIPSLALALATAHSHYGPSKSTPPLPLCILFVVQSPERNIFDQRLLEYALLATHHIPTFRLPFPLTSLHTSILPTNPLRPLLYSPPHLPHPYEVSTLYFRASYSPAEYTSPAAFPSRLHLERSAAIKCPSILTHLAGSKKVQQVLAAPSSPHLARFLRSPASRARLTRTFTAIHPLDASPAGVHAKALALDPTSAAHYVLKPQREGGGNNIYRGAIPAFLKSLGEERMWRGHILMELIEPPGLRNVVLREGVLKEGEVVGELGVYGGVLWRAGGEREGGESGGGESGGGEKGRGEVLWNEEAGWLLRTKGRESEEGGVAAGFGAVDSVLLVDV